jgi:hypothetical protein
MGEVTPFPHLNEEIVLQLAEIGELASKTSPYIAYHWVVR